VEYLCESGASQNLKNKEGWFPIHLAAYYGHIDIVFYLKQLAQRNNDIAVFQQDEEEEEEDAEQDEETSFLNESNEEDEEEEEEEEFNDLLFLFNFSSLKI